MPGPFSNCFCLIRYTTCMLALYSLLDHHQMTSPTSVDRWGLFLHGTSPPCLPRPRAGAPPVAGTPHRAGWGQAEGAKPLGAPRIKHTLPHRACARGVEHDFYRPRHASPRGVRAPAKFRVDRTTGACAGGGPLVVKGGGESGPQFSPSPGNSTRYLIGTDPLKKGA